MSVWWHKDPGTGWYRHDTKSEAMAAAKDDLQSHADYAASDGWCDGIEQLSVWKTKRAKPDDAYDDWVEDNGVKVAEAFECFRDERPEPPDDLTGDDLEEWQRDNWSVDWDFETIVDYELREITPPKGAKDE